MLTTWLKRGFRPGLGVALLIIAISLSQQSALADQTTIQVGNIWFCNEVVEGRVCDTTIQLGDTVIWNFESPTQHTTTECGDSCDEPTDSPAWDSGLVGTGSTFEYTFNEPGTFLYYCQVHPILHRGIIIVQDSASTATPESPTSTPVPPTATTAPPSPTPARVSGDVNCNGSVDSIDAELVLQLTAGLVDSLFCGENADANEDGTTNAIDAALILQFSAGLLGRLPRVGAPELMRYPYVQQVTMTSALVVWTTSEDGVSEVRFGTDSSLSATAAATSRQLVEREMPMRKDAREEVPRTYYVHAAELSGLQAGEMYGYTVLSDGIELTSADSLSFRTDSGPSRLDLSLLVFGDSGSGWEFQRAIRDAMLGREFDLALHTGDLAYTDGTYQQLDDYFFAMYREIASQVPFYPSLGNHDYNALGGEPYLNAFYLPENASQPAHRERYYSFDYGPAHFVALDTEIWEGARRWGPADLDEMRDWLEQDLATTEQSWKFVYFHKPPYSSSNNPVEFDPGKIVQVLEQYNVDLVFDGHDHVYARTLPLKDGRAQLIGEGGIVYVTTGGGGGGLHVCEPRPFTASCIGLALPPEPVFHFLDLSINNDCQLSYDVVGLGGRVLEGFEFDRCDPDSDSDSYTDAAEARVGSDPLDPSSLPTAPTSTSHPRTSQWGEATRPRA